MYNKTVYVLFTTLSLLIMADMPRVVLAQGARIVAQKIVEEIKTAHSEITSLEVAARQSRNGRCETIAATEAKEIGQKCDKDELTAIKTNQPFIEEEKSEFDATLPLHDAAGAVIGTVGMDFTKENGLTKATVAQRAKSIVGEIEKKITSREELLRPLR
jgi:hypothetical protein